MHIVKANIHMTTVQENLCPWPHEREFMGYVRVTCERESIGTLKKYLDWNISKTRLFDVVSADIARA